MRTVVLLGSVLVLAACSSSRPAAPATIEQPTADETAPAEGSAAYDALVVAPVPGELARAGNDQDVSVTTATLTVTVPAGQRLGSRIACEGLSSATIRTDPDSGAASELACGRSGTPEELVAEADVVTVRTTYSVVVTVPEPARWSAVVYAAGG